MPRLAGVGPSHAGVVESSRQITAHEDLSGLRLTGDPCSQIDGVAIDIPVPDHERTGRNACVCSRQLCLTDRRAQPSH
jgi:hypothetical protein